MGRSMAQVIEERAEARGRAEGEERGETRGLRVALETVLRERFGAVPPEAAARLLGADSKQLNAWLRAAVTARALEDVGVLDTPSR